MSEDSPKPLPKCTDVSDRVPGSERTGNNSPVRPEIPGNVDAVRVNQALSPSTGKNPAEVGADATASNTASPATTGSVGSSNPANAGRASGTTAANVPTPGLIAKAWRFGNLRYKFKPIQKRLITAFKDCSSFLFVCLIARQTGKSYTWATVSLEYCLQYAKRHPGARIRYGTAFQTDLEEFIIPVFETIIADAPRDCRPKFNRNRSKYVFPAPNKAEIKFVGLDKHPDGLRGNALDLVIIDEAGFVARLRYLFTSIILPMLRNRPQLRVVMSSTPSETPDHEFTEFVHEAAEGGYLFKATIDDDETVTEEVKDRLAKECGGKDSTTYRREFMVEFVTESDLAIIPEWQDSYIQEVFPDEFYPYYHRYSALDLGVTDFTAGLYGYYHFKRASLVVLSETGMRGPEMTTDKLAAQIKRREWELWGGKSDIEEALCDKCKRFLLDGTCRCREWDEKKLYRRVADNNNPQLLQDFSAMHGIHFRATDKDELPAMINEVRLLVKQGRLLVHPSCEMLIGCLRYGIYNDKKQKREFARSKIYGHYDWLASLVYLVRNLDTYSNPIPKSYGLDPQTHFIRPEALKSDMEMAYGNLLGKKFTSVERK